MHPTLRSLRPFIPGFVRGIANRVLGGATTYVGPYGSWREACAASAGYGDSDILERVRGATLRVIQGEADYEQDGVAIRGHPACSQALAGIMLAAATEGGDLSVIDLGGSLGSHYLKWRPWLVSLPRVRWQVVEQAHFVEAGSQLFVNTEELLFCGLPELVCERPSVLFASSVFQYLPDPLGTLRSLLERQPKVIVLDRTPLSTEVDCRIMVQRVPRSLGKASYPLWVIPKARVHEMLTRRYRLVNEFNSPDVPIRARRAQATYGGSVWLRID